MNFQLDAAALRFAADILESAIVAGDVAEVAAPVEGESGRAEAVAQRDEIYEDPAGWLRKAADGLVREEEGGLWCPDCTHHFPEHDEECINA